MRTLKTFSAFLVICSFLAACATNTPASLAPTSTLPAATTTPTSSATRLPTPLPSPSITPAGTWINLEPASGTPGTVVHIRGYLPGGLPQVDLASQSYTTYAAVCWNGCQTGLEEDGLQVTWSQTESELFSLDFTVPPIPWLAHDGFHPLEMGDYTVDLINLDPSKLGCNSPSGCPVVPDASATFHLTSSATYPACQEQYCGSLVASPAEAGPGERVQVKGWAPLVQFVGQPFGYDLVLEPKDNTSSERIMHLVTQQNEVVQQSMDGNWTASFLVPQYGNDGLALSPGSYTLALDAPLSNEKNAFPILVAPTPFSITPAKQWAQLPNASPMWIQTASDLATSSMTQDPLNPNRIAYCASGKVEISQDSGSKWEAIPVNSTSIKTPSDRLVFGEDQPMCISITFDSSHPESLYAVFDLVDKQYGAPPIYYAGYYTVDLGKTWQLVPVPAIDVSQPLINDSFAGFWTDGKIVQVLYYGKPSADNQPLPLLAKQTVDGGLTWADALLACPDTGPCVRWGGAPSYVGGMGADLPQVVLASLDGGKTWQDTGQSIDSRMTIPHELVAFSPVDLLLISGTHRFPLRVSSDGGITWQVFSLPALPGSQGGGYQGYPGLQLLSDGSLIAMRPDTGQWMSLSPTTQDWCPTGLTFTTLSPGLLRLTGNQVWWFSESTMQPQSTPQSELACQK